MKHKKSIRALFRLLFLFLMIFSVGLTASAAWKVRSFTYNKITTPTFGMNIIEEYNPPPEGIFPGQSVVKKVQIRNEGTTESLVRVDLTKRIGDYIDDRFVDDLKLDVTKITLNINNEDWLQLSDGWYYYKKPLKEGEMTTPLLYDFGLPSDLGNEYRNKHIQIIVNAESVQYLNNGLELWDLTYKDLEMEEPVEEYDMKETSVTFLDPIRKFDIELSKTDLFHNFKNVLPGSTRTQKVRVKSRYKEPVEIHLVSMDVDKNSGIDNSLVKDLLFKYAKVKVQDRNGQTIYQGAIKGKGECDIPLGIYSSGQARDLKVSLQVSSEMSKEYSNLMGQVKWAFAALETEPEEEPPTPEEPPKENPPTPDPPEEKPVLVVQKLVQTSDYNHIALGVGMFVVGIIGLVVFRKREEVREG